MSDFDPPLKYGLTHADNYVEDYTTYNQSGVYVLRLSQPRSIEILEEYWYRYYEIDPPREIRVEAFEATSVYYVGAAKHVRERIQRHLDMPNQRASIMAAFPPHSVRQVWPYDSPDEAFTKESIRGFEWQARNPDAATWVDGDLL